MAQEMETGALCQPGEVGWGGRLKEKQERKQYLIIYDICCNQSKVCCLIAAPFQMHILRFLYHLAYSVVLLQCISCGFVLCIFFRIQSSIANWSNDLSLWKILYQYVFDSYLSFILSLIYFCNPYQLYLGPSCFVFLVSISLSSLHQLFVSLSCILSILFFQLYLLFFKLEYSCFTVLCQFLLTTK